jgi:hypothetical protein
MKTLSLLTPFWSGMILLIGASIASAQPPNLEGQWESETEGLVNIQQIDDYVWIESSTPCPNGGQRPFILSGHLQGNILTGIMWRCTEQSLITNCGHPQIYSIQFTAQVHENLFFRNQIQMLVLQIKCNYEMEIWNKDDCKRDHNEPRLDFLAGASPTTQTPTPSPTPTPGDPCAWARCGLEYFQCQAWQKGLASTPYARCP